MFFINLFFSNQVYANNDWFKIRHNYNNSGSLELSIQKNQVPKTWTYNSNTHVYGYKPGMSVWSSAAIAKIKENIVIAAGSYDKNIYLFNALNGELLWRYTTGDGVYSEPVIKKTGSDFTLYATSTDQLIYAINADEGTRKWSTAVTKYTPTIGGSRLSSPCLGKAGNLHAVFVGYWVFDKSLSQNMQIGGVIAVDAVTGKKIWQKEFLDNRVSTPLFSTINNKGMLFVTSEDGNLRALNSENGEVLWFHRETEPIKTYPLIYNSKKGKTIIFGSHFGKMRSLEAETGKEVWSFKTGNWITSAAVHFKNKEKDYIVFGSYDYKLYSLNAETGVKIWEQSAGGPIYSTPAILNDKKDNIIVYTAWDHFMYGVSGKDGKLIFKIPIGKPIWEGIIMGESNWSSPSAIKFNNQWIIYYGSYNGSISSIPLNEARIINIDEPVFNKKFWLTYITVLFFTIITALYLNRKMK